MITQQLKEKISIRFQGYGHFIVTIKYKGNFYKCTTTNTMAIDKIGEEKREPKQFYVTEKQALLSLWNECKNKNNL